MVISHWPLVISVTSRATVTILAMYAELNVPVVAKQTKGPSTTLVFLGIELDTTTMQIWLPADKLTHLKQTIANWLGRKACTKRELQSLAGLLQYVCKVVRPGRWFLQRIFETITIVWQPYHGIRLNLEVRSDMAWWHAFLEQ